MKCYTFLVLIILSSTLQAKEWKNLKVYQKETHQEILSPSDWLKMDRIHNTIVWQKANRYNLNHHLPQEYVRILERRDYYEWAYKELKKQGHEVVWVAMAHFISKKITLMKTFPYTLFLNRNVVYYANDGSELVFNNVFEDLKAIFNSDIVLKAEKALQWDESISHKEQFVLLESIYKNMDASSLKKIERIAKGKFLYSLMVPKSIRFKGDISNPIDRYSYAINKLRDYCIKTYK